MALEKYSVLTTLYAEENPDDFQLAVDSMLGQTVKPAEYVVVVDGPIGDDLDDVLAKYEASEPIFKVVRLARNEGCGVASSVGVEACSYDLIARIDSDDVSLPDRCRRELICFREDPELAVVGTDMYEFEKDPSDPVSVKRMPSSPSEIYNFGRRRNPFNHSTVMFRKSVIQENGGYSHLRRGIDYELFSRLLMRGCKCRNIDTPLVLFRSGSSRIKRKKNWTNLKCDTGIYWRNYKEGYISFFDFAIVLVRQMGLFVMPRPMASWLFQTFYRQRIQ